jgi:hypothetical protein
MGAMMNAHKMSVTKLMGRDNVKDHVKGARIILKCN